MDNTLKVYKNPLFGSETYTIKDYNGKWVPFKPLTPFESFSFLDGSHDMPWCIFRTRKYRINFYRDLAKKKICEPWGLPGYEDFLEKIYPDLKYYAECYKDDANSLSVIISNDEMSKSLVSASKNRFSKSYRRSLQYKYDRLGDITDVYPAKLFTFTVDLARFYSYKEIRKRTSKAMNNIITYMRRVAERCSKPFVFVRAYETTKEHGMLHVHLLALGISWYLPDELEHIKRLWYPLSKASNAVDYKTPRDKDGERKMVTGYVCKYIFKQFREYVDKKGNITIETNRDTVIGWAFGWRSFSISSDLRYQLFGWQQYQGEGGCQEGEGATGLVLPLYANKNSKWTYCCSTREPIEPGIYAYSDAPHRHRYMDEGG